MIRRQKFINLALPFSNNITVSKQRKPSSEISTTASFVSFHGYEQKRHMSLMPLLEVAVEVSETALVTLNNACSLLPALSSSVVTVSPALTPLVAMFAFGFCMRLASLLILTLYSDRAQDRFASAMPSLCKHFLLYAEVAWNPHALKAEVEMAATKLHERRNKTMSKFKTGNYRIWIPTLMSMTWMSSGCVVAVVLAPTCLPVASAAAAFTSFSCVPVIGLNLAASGIWLYNFEQYLTFRRGFWDQRDQLLERLRNYGRIGALVWILFFSTASFMTFQYYVESPSESTGIENKEEKDATSNKQNNNENEKEETISNSTSTFSHGQQSLFILLPFYFLGATVAGFLRFSILHRLAKSILATPLQWPKRRPKLHGTYGEYRWSYAEHLGTLRWAEKNTGESKRAFENYDKAKLQLEYDCDLRLSKMPMFKNLFVDSRYTRRPDMPAPPEDIHVVRGGGSGGAGGGSVEPKVPDGAELRTTQGFSRNGN